ncbi:hypothetical protein KIPB_014932, partial [Kipferlia bialata]
VNSDPASDVYDTEVFELGVSFGLAMTPRVWTEDHSWGNSTHISYTASMYNSTSWEVSSGYGPVAVDGPQAFQLVSMLGALGIAPWVTQFTDGVAPYFAIEGDFLEYGKAQVFFQGATTVVATLPLRDY